MAMSQTMKKMSQTMNNQLVTPAAPQEKRT